ncbi:hypothetical protein NEHOM01_0544 [Nematocida homosporus]|uniref:uncharacterized protein n=1 Tax=Nematocida homosporus TaxID=1912981 RepID=UPI00221F1372|nr:uncharacterized protein NEHOM01_0544 [Nematocida homosporus]KAI5184993.1 hypothetical protein NEHOM01_0544 [Nematocida homosporus]
MQLSVGDVFKSKNEAQNAIRMYAVDNNFNFETTDSTPKKYTIQCKERRSHGCDAIITAALRKKDNMFVIKKLKNMHNCPQQSSCSIQSSSRYIADELRDMPDVLETRVGQIINRISLRRGIKIGYLAAWRAKQEVLGEEVGEESAVEESLLNAIAENKYLNPEDITRASNFKQVLSSWVEQGYNLPVEQGFIRRVVKTLSAFDTSGPGLDTLFYASSLSLHVYKYSRPIIELSCYQRHNEIREHAGYAFVATSYDAFDTPYILSIFCVPEYCPRKEGWIGFIKELLAVIDTGVLLMDWEDSHSTVEEIQKEIQKKNGLSMGGGNGLGSSGGSSRGSSSSRGSEGGGGEGPWSGHFDIEESIRAGELDGLAAGGNRVSLFLRTRSLCKEIFATYPCPSTIGLIWSLCNSPDLATFMMYYRKVKAKNVPSLLSLLSSLPTSMWAKYLCGFPLYNKNNTSAAELESIQEMFTLSLVDTLCMGIKMICDNAVKKKETIAHSELASKKATDRARFGDAINKAMDINVSKAGNYEVDVGRAPGGVCKASWIDPRKLSDEEEQGQGIVYAGGNLRFYVDLRLRVCSCMKFQEMSYPCSHACALIAKIGGHPYAYIDEIYSVDTLTQMFKPASMRCIVNEPIRGTEERRRVAAPLKRGLAGFEEEEFSCLEYKENMPR